MTPVGQVYNLMGMHVLFFEWSYMQILMNVQKKCISAAKTATILLVPTCAVVMLVTKSVLMRKPAMVKIYMHIHTTIDTHTCTCKHSTHTYIELHN